MITFIIFLMVEGLHAIPSNPSKDNIGVEWFENVHLSKITFLKIFLFISKIPGTFFLAGMLFDACSVDEAEI